MIKMNNVKLVLMASISAQHSSYVFRSNFVKIRIA